MPVEIYYTVEEAAKILKLHPQTLRRWIRHGKLPAKRFGRQFRVSPENIERAAQSTLPEEEELSHLGQAALGEMAELWDNDEDAIYDDWKELYGIEKG